MTIRSLKLDDVTWAAKQHARLMAHSVFARFGVSFLECFYRGFATSPHAVAFVLEEEDKRKAVIASASDRNGLLRDIKRRFWLQLGWHGVLGALRHGSCRRLLFRSRSYPKTGAEMIFITVEPDARGQGIARSLITATLDEFRRRGVNCVSVSIESDNRGVKDLLESMNFTVTKTFMFADKDNDMMERKLEGPTA